MPTYDDVEQSVSHYLRDAMAQRYETANIRRYPGFDVLSDGQIDALRAFGLGYIYPEWEARCFQQTAFDALMDLLSSPTRLKPLVAVALKSLWRFGRQLPRAIEAGKEVIHAFEATRRLEQCIIDWLQESLPDAAAVGSEDVARALDAIPREDFETFINDIVTLMRLLADRSLLDTGYSVLKDIGAAMEKRPDSYGGIEMEGIHYALNIMEEGMALFDALDDAAVKAAIETIPQVEWDWYESVVGGDA